MIKAYMSHPIRGALKDKATQHDMECNCNAALILAEQIRLYMATNYREVDFELYVPAEHEAFVNRSYRYGMLTVQQILHIDCKIIEEDYNDALLIYAPFGPPVEGCYTEWVHARKCDIPVLIFEGLDDFKDTMEAYLEAKGIYE
jgi:hypothetical protein